MNGYTHRDIHPSRIALYTNNVVKFNTVGFPYNFKKLLKRDDFSGHINYSAPELILERPEFTNKVDIVLRSTVDWAGSAVLVVAFVTLAGFSTTEFNLSMRRQDIANFLGLTIETVSRQLAELSKQGIITVKQRGIQINDLNLLKAIIEHCATQSLVAESVLSWGQL